VANPEHLAKLKEGVGAWNEWRQLAGGYLKCELQLAPPIGTLGDAVARGEFDTDLRTANLENANLRGAYLERSNFSMVNLAGVDLRSANLGHADLGDADFSGADVRTAEFYEANLQRADFRDADLRGADFRGAHLGEVEFRGAKLRAVDFRNANLTRADLRGANLAGVDLGGANLSEARLHGVKLDEAVCFSTAFTNVDLVDTIGLETIEHLGPSSLGTDTLARAEGTLPIAFLRGCGLPDWEIEAARLYASDLSASQKTDILYQVDRLLSESPIQISRLFVSYSWSDSLFVDRLGGKFDELHVRYWRDKKDATAGRLDKVIDRAVRLNPTVLLVLSKNIENAPWIEYEVDRAVEISRELKRDVLCPIELDRSWLANDSLSGQLKAQIKKYNVLDFSDWRNEESLDRQMKKLIDGLNLHYQDPKSL